MTFEHASKLLGLSKNYLVMYKKNRGSTASVEELYKEVLAYRLVDKELKDSLLKVYYELSEKRLCYKFSQFVHSKGCAVHERSILSVFDYLLINSGKNLGSQKQHIIYQKLLDLYEEFKHEEKYTRIHSRA